MLGLKSLLVKTAFVATTFVGCVGGGMLLKAPMADAQSLWPGYFVDNIQTKAVAGTGIVSLIGFGIFGLIWKLGAWFIGLF